MKSAADVSNEAKERNYITPQKRRQSMMLGGKRFRAHAVATMKASKELIEFVQELHAEAVRIECTTPVDEYGQGWVGPEKFGGLLAGCRLLVAQLGPFGKVWDKMLQNPEGHYDIEPLRGLKAVLNTILNALAKGRLVTMEEVVSAEVLGDLLEHAEELIKAKYFLAAAVILRAILEERLRKLCESNNCMPTAQRPTIENFKQSLQAAKVIDKIGVKDVDWMAGVGNAAAHSLPEYRDDDVPPLYQRVEAFLARFSAV